ncbi:MAG: hypothetical protein LQ348_002565 [Seirophora lacunosa]|nr:MAG: hypothetical protein LQ348_002565 [Seirophora lacunosa]
MSLLSEEMMDEATTNLILQLHWEDIKTLEFKGKGKESAGLSDVELALQFQQEEFERAVTRRADQRMAASIDRALLDDRVNLAVLADEERRASDDRKVACQLGGHANPADLQAPAVDFGNETLVEFGSSGTENADGNNGSLSSPFESEVGERSAWGARRRLRPSDGAEYQCDSCMEVTLGVELPCGHHYCRQCTVRLFIEALPDESLFPVRCCRQSIPMSLVHHFLGSDLARQVEKKAVEYATTNRTYCHEASCAAFIEPGYIHGSTGTCPRQQCGRRTCCLCKKPAHSGDCLQNGDFGETLELAEVNGWRRCEQCHNMVELNYGCNHMT